MVQENSYNAIMLTMRITMLASDYSAFKEITTGGSEHHYSCDNLPIEVSITLTASRLGMVEVGYTTWYGCYGNWPSV